MSSLGTSGERSLVHEYYDREISSLQLLVEEDDIELELRRIRDAENQVDEAINEMLTVAKLNDLMTSNIELSNG